MKTPLKYNIRSFNQDQYTGTGTGTGTISSFTYKFFIDKENFKDKNFKNISIYESEIINSDFTESYHINTTFNKVTVNNVMFKEITAPFCRFNFTYFKDVDFSYSELLHVNFDLSRFENVKFDNSNMGGVSFINARFERVTFNNANLKNSIFMNKGISPQFLYTKFDNADLTGSTLVKECDYQDLKPRYADLSNAILDKSSLEHLIAILKNTLATTKFMISDENGLHESTVPTEYQLLQLNEIAHYQSKLDAFHINEEIELAGNSIQVEEYHE